MLVVPYQCALKQTQGMTIHSWGAVTPGMHNLDRQISCIKTCKPAYKRWRDTKVLVIDESMSAFDFIYLLSEEGAVSMVDGQTFDTLAKLADELRASKRTNKPFGGIQVCSALFIAHNTY